MSTNTQQKTIQLLEYNLGATPETRVDREKATVTSVKVLGEASKNAPPRNHLYPRTTREKAIPLFEGAAVYIDHPPKGVDPSQARSYRDRCGTLLNVRESGTGLVADYHLNPEHPMSKQILWDAENAPQNLGFSINGRGRDMRQTDGSVLIEEIPVLYSVDLVSRPATTRGLYESLDLETPPVKQKLRVLAESLKVRRPGCSRALLEMAEAGLMSPDTQMEEPQAMGPDVDEASDHEATLKQGFRGAVMAILDDESLDMKGKLNKIKEILQAEEKLIGGESEEPAPTEPDEAPTEESHKVSIDRATRELREELSVRDLIEDAGLKFAKPGARKTFIKSLVPLAESERKELIEERKAAGGTAATPAAAGGQKPRSAAAWGGDAATATKTVQESRDGDAAIGDDEARKRRVQKLRGGR